MRHAPAVWMTIPRTIPRCAHRHLELLVLGFCQHGRSGYSVGDGFPRHRLLCRILYRCVLAWRVRHQALGKIFQVINLLIDLRKDPINF